MTTLLDNLKESEQKHHSSESELRHPVRDCPTQNSKKEPDDGKLKLYVVWIDTWVNAGCGIHGSDWEMNSEPRELAEALRESSECTSGGFPTTVTLEGITPRPDGLFSNPATDP